MQTSRCEGPICPTVFPRCSKHISWSNKTMHPFLLTVLVSLHHCSYNSIAKRQQQHTVFSVLSARVSEAKPPPYATHNSPSYISKDHSSLFPEHLTGNSCWVTCLLWPLNPFQSFLRHSLPIVQTEIQNTISITLEERFVANDYFGQKKSP